MIKFSGPLRIWDTVLVDVHHSHSPFHTNNWDWQCIYIHSTDFHILSQVSTLSFTLSSTFSDFHSVSSHVFFYLYVYCISFWTVCSDFNPDLVNLTLVDVWLNQIEFKYGKKEPYCNSHVTVGCPTDFPIKFCLTDVKLGTLVSHRE